MYRLTRGRLPHLGRWTRWLLAATCVLFAVAAALDAHPAPGGSSGMGIAVAVASRDLPAGRLLTRQDVLVQRMPASLVPSGSRAGPDGLVGHRLGGPVQRREPITAARLLGRDLVAGLPAGTVAVAVTVADQHTTDLVHAGDRVDLVAAARASDLAAAAVSGVDPSAGQVVVTHLLVLASLTSPTSSVADESGAPAATLVLAADRATAVRITRIAATHDFAAVGVSP